VTGEIEDNVGILDSLEMVAAIGALLGLELLGIPIAADIATFSAVLESEISVRSDVHDAVAVLASLDTPFLIIGTGIGVANDFIALVSPSTTEIQSVVGFAVDDVVVTRSDGALISLLLLLLLVTLLLLALLLVSLLLLALLLIALLLLGLLVPLLLLALLLAVTSSTTDLLELPELLLGASEAPGVDVSTILAFPHVEIDDLTSVLGIDSESTRFLLDLPDTGLVRGDDAATIARLAVGVDVFTSTGVFDQVTSVGLLKIPLLVEILGITLPSVGLATWGYVKVGTTLYVLEAVSSVAERHFLI